MNTCIRTARVWDCQAPSMQRPVDPAYIFLAQRTHRRFQAQVADQVAVFGLVQVAAGSVKLLLGVQYIEIGAHAHLLSELAGFQHTFARGERLLQRLDLGDAADYAEIGLTSL